VFGSDHDESRIVETPGLQFLDPRRDGGVDELEFTEQRLSGRAGGIEISAGYAVALLDELLAHTEGLEVHAEDGGNLGVLGAEVVLAIDLVEDGVDLQGVVALNVLEAVGPGGEVGAGITEGSAGCAEGRGDAGKGDHVRVDLWTVEVVEGSGADTGSSRGVCGVLVGPCGVSAVLVNYAEDGVGADEFPGENGFAAVGGIADEALGIDGGEAAVGEGCSG